HHRSHQALERPASVIPRSRWPARRAAPLPGFARTMSRRLSWRNCWGQRQQRWCCAGCSPCHCPPTAWRLARSTAHSALLGGLSEPLAVLNHFARSLPQELPVLAPTLPLAVASRVLRLTVPRSASYNSRERAHPPEVVTMPTRSYAWPQSHWDWYQHLAFKHGVRAGEMAFVGGQVDKSAAGEPLHAFDLATQTAVVIRHIDAVLREFGAGLANVVKLVAFYATDGRVDETAFLADIGRHVLAHGGAPDGVGPAITLVPLPCLALPGMMVEIEAIAMLAKDGERLPRTTANPPALAPLPAPFSYGVRCGEHIWTS